MPSFSWNLVLSFGLCARHARPELWLLLIPAILYSSTTMRKWKCLLLMPLLIGEVVHQHVKHPHFV